jgi:hypothetical protein
MDSTKREEILTRYRDHSRRFKVAAARRGAAPTASILPLGTAGPDELVSQAS